MVPNSLISLAFQRFVAVMVYGFMPHVSMVPTANAMSVHWDRQLIVRRVYYWRLYIRKANIKLGANHQTQKSPKLLRKHIAQPDFELVEERFQLVQGQVVFAFLNPKKRHVRSLRSEAQV